VDGLGFFETVIGEAGRGNFSFFILLAGILQLAIMWRDRGRKK
jgi:hypothetical protein